jgi:hypothetical protein
MKMTFNLSLIQTFAISVLVLTVIVPVGVFASPIFETDTIDEDPGFFLFEPEHSIAVSDLSGDKISDLDVVVFDGPTAQEVYFTYLAPDHSFLYIGYTTNLLDNAPFGASPYSIDLAFPAQLVQLNEFVDDGAGGAECNIPSQPKISVTDSHVFVSWLDNKLDEVGGSPCTITEASRIATISIAKSAFSEDGSVGTSFFTDTPAYFDTGSELPVSFDVAASGSSAYLIWDNSTSTSASSIRSIPFDGAGYVASPSNDDFGSEVILSTSSSNSNPSIVIDDSEIHVAWQDEDVGDSDIKLRTSTDEGISFGAVTDVSGTNSVSSTNVKLSADDGEVNVSWLEGSSNTDQVFVASSGNSFTPVAISTNAGQSTAQQIVTNGTNVFVVWQDNIDGGASNEILFSKSTDSGSTFGTPVNLSQSSGDSVLPTIAAHNSTHVNIAWQDNSFAHDLASNIDGQVWFKSSSDSGASFGGLQVISESTTDGANTVNGNITPVPIPNISSNSNIVAVAWSSDSSSIPSGFESASRDGSLKIATQSTVDISFNSTEYLSPRNATVTVVDSSASTSVDVDVFFPQSGKQTITLFEGPSGIFSKSLLLYNGTNDDLAVGDIFTANYTSGSSTITTQAMIQDDNIFLDFLTAGNAIGVFTHDIGDIVGLIYNNTDADIDSGTVDTINVTITSDADPIGTTITLTETGINTGLFNVTNGLVFMDGALTPNAGDSLTITKTQDSGNDAIIETLDQKIITTTTPSGVILTLTETGIDTNVFTENISICDSSDIHCLAPNISGVAGDFISISNVGGSQTSNGIILPDDVASRDAILVSCGVSECGTVTAKYNGLAVSINVEDTLASGGGGGGVSRAGLVVNALAGLGSFGGGSDGSPPINSLGTLSSNENFDAPDEIIQIIENYDSTVPLEPIPTFGCILEYHQYCFYRSWSSYCHNFTIL